MRWQTCMVHETCYIGTPGNSKPSRMLSLLCAQQVDHDPRRTQANKQHAHWNMDYSTPSSAYSLMHGSIPSPACHTDTQPEPHQRSQRTQIITSADCATAESYPQHRIRHHNTGPRRLCPQHPKQRPRLLILRHARKAARHAYALRWHHYAPPRDPFFERLFRRFLDLLELAVVATGAAVLSPLPAPPCAGSSLFALNVSGSVELLPLPHAYVGT